MKGIRLILALYILLMTVYPCNDNKTCLDEQRTGISASSQGNHDHGSSEQDLCTPFCICSCCAAHIQINSSPPLSFTNHSHNTKLTPPYIEKSLLSSSNSIWQPPKI